MRPCSTRSYAAASFDPAEARRIVEAAKTKGLIQSPGTVVPITAGQQAPAAESEMRSEWVDIDPATAEKWLGANIRNRSLKKDVVRAYARDMGNGQWASTHQGIAFNERGELIDGQHRLTAIAQSGKTIRMLVTTGIPVRIQNQQMTTMDTVDRGCTRSTSERLKLEHGFKHSSEIASITALLANICYGKRTRRLSVGNTLEIYQTFKDEIDWVIQHRSKAVGLRSAGVNAAFAFALAAHRNTPVGFVLVKTLFKRLVTGKDIGKSNSLNLLRNLLTCEDAKLITKTANRGLAELVLQVIHDEIEGKAIKELQHSLQGRDRFRSLQPARVAQIAKIFELPE